jgi:hypothetical protein
LTGRNSGHPGTKNRQVCVQARQVFLSGSKDTARERFSKTKAPPLKVKLLLREEATDQ